MTTQPAPSVGTTPVLPTQPARRRTRIRFAAAAAGVAALAVAFSGVLPTLASASTHAAVPHARCSAIHHTNGR
jgi:hypothetical protein